MSDASDLLSGIQLIALGAMLILTPSLLVLAIAAWFAPTTEGVEE